MSAELASRDRGLTVDPQTGRGITLVAKGLANLLYNEFSDEDDDGTSVSHTSMETEDSDIISRGITRDPPNVGTDHLITGGAPTDRMTVRDVATRDPGHVTARGPRSLITDHVAAGHVTTATGDKVPEGVAKNQALGDGDAARGRRSGASGPAAALGDGDTARGRRSGTSGSHVAASTEDLEARGRIVSASMTSLSTQFGQSPEALETDIAKSVGLEQLTRLSRATRARVVVDSLQVDPSAVNIIMAHNTSKKKSTLPSSAALR